MIVRCEVNALQEGTKPPSMVALKALVEFCQKQGSNMDWRQKLESQRGAVFATELKNNANKIAKWTSAALLADIDFIKLGYNNSTITFSSTFVQNERVWLLLIARRLSGASFCYIDFARRVRSKLFALFGLRGQTNAQMNFYRFLQSSKWCYSTT